MRKKSYTWVIVLSCIVLVLGAVATTLYLLNEWVVTVTIRGEKQQVLEVGSQYHEYGAYAEGHGSLFRFIEGQPEIETVGQVDTNTLGTYEIHYRAEYYDGFAEATRRVTVIDTQVPVITLLNEEDHYTLPGTPYEEEGFTAQDNYDGDITDRVTSVEKDGVVYYEVKDSSGNRATAEREIFYDDREAPVLTLEDGDLTIALGDEYEEPGYHAEDNVDGNITDKVKIKGEVDVYAEGSYTLKYTAKDSYGNKTTKKRIVTVKRTRKENEGEKLVYLTFDDGPGQYTERLLKILKKYHVKATFFVTNQFPQYQDLIAQEAEDGHAVGVHTYSHDFSKVYASTKAFWEDFEAMQDIIEAQTGSRTKLMRFAGGSSNSISRNYSKGIMRKLTRQAEQKGYTYFDWNVLSGDAGDTEDSKQIAKNILEGIRGHNTSIVLCHDIHDYTVDAMERMIKKAIKEGFTFEALEPDSYSAHHRLNN